MKRYVTEFANDIINTNKNNPLMRNDIKEKIENYIENVLQDYKAGLVTSREAIYLMSKKYDFLN